MKNSPIKKITPKENSCRRFVFLLVATAFFSLAYGADAHADTQTELLNQRTVELLKNHQHFEAMELAAEWLKKGRSANDKTVILGSYLNIGRILIDARLFEEARQQYMQAMELATDLNQQNPTFEINKSITEIDMRLGLYDHALKACGKAEKIAAKTKDEAKRRDQLLWCFKARLQCYIKKGNLKDALKATREAAAVFNDHKPFLARVIFDQGECFFLMGKYYQSKTRYESVISFGDPFAASKAVERLKRMETVIAVTEMLKTHEANHTKTEKPKTKQSQPAGKMSAPARSATSTDLYTSGATLEKDRKFLEATDHYLRSITAANSDDKHPALRSRIGIGRVLEALGLYEESHRWYLNAMAFATNLDNQEPSYFFKQTLAHLNLKLGKYEKVLKICRTLEKLAKKEENQKQKLQIQIWIAITKMLCHNKQGNVKQTIQLALEIQKDFAKIDQLVFFALLQEGRGYMHQRKFADARQKFENALGLAKTSRDKTAAQKQLNVLNNAKKLLEKWQTISL